MNPTDPRFSPTLWGLGQLAKSVLHVFLLMWGLWILLVCLIAYPWVTLGVLLLLAVVAALAWYK